MNKTQFKQSFRKPLNLPQTASEDNSKVSTIEATPVNKKRASGEDNEDETRSKVRRTEQASLALVVPHSGPSTIPTISHSTCFFGQPVFVV